MRLTKSASLWFTIDAITQSRKSIDLPERHRRASLGHEEVLVKNAKRPAQGATKSDRLVATALWDDTLSPASA